MCLNVLTLQLQSDWRKKNNQFRGDTSQDQYGFIPGRTEAGRSGGWPERSFNKVGRQIKEARSPGEERGGERVRTQEKRREGSMRRKEYRKKTDACAT